MRDEISSRFNELKFQPGLKISIWSAPKMELFEKIVKTILQKDSMLDV